MLIYKQLQTCVVYRYDQRIEIHSDLRAHSVEFVEMDETPCSTLSFFLTGVLLRDGVRRFAVKVLWSRLKTGSVRRFVREL